MKRKLFYLTILTFIILIFKNYSLVLNTSIEAASIWLYKVFPYLFIMIILNDLLLQADFSGFFKNAHTYIFIMSLLSGTPTSAYIIKGLYLGKNISKNNANLVLLFTYFCNPLFLYSFFTLIFNNPFITIKLMLIHYLSNIIIFLFIKKKLNKEMIPRKKVHIDLASAITKSMNTTIMVLGTITFYMILSNILLTSFSITNFTSTIIKGTLEVTQGLNSILNLNISLKIKEMIAILFISFGGLSIHTQIKCIIENTDLEYSYFLLGRILQVIISLILVCTIPYTG